MSQTPGKMGRFNVKSEEKTPSDANKIEKGFDGGNNVWREAFAETSEALNALQVKFDCWEGNNGGTIIGMHKAHDGVPEHEARRRRQRRNIDSEREGIRTTMAGPGRTKHGGHEGHATGKMQEEGKESGETVDQPEHGIRPSARSMYRLLAIAP